MKLGKALAFSLVGLLVLAGCGGASTGAAQGKPVDVEAQLEKNFPGRIAAIKKDAAYWIMPYAMPVEMESASDPKPSCMFLLLRSDYPGSGAYENYKILSNSLVKIILQPLNADGSLGQRMPGNEAIRNLSDVKPSLFDGGASFNFDSCPNHTLAAELRE